MSGAGAASTKASFPVPPPIQGQAIGMVRDGQVYLNQIGIEFMTKLWASIQGEGGIKIQVDGNASSITIIFEMSGDGTLSNSGVLTITASEGRVFTDSAFTDTTDAGNITHGTLNSGRLDLGPGLIDSGGILITEDSIVTDVAHLPTQPYRQGARRFVSDATAPAFGVAVVGGGTVPAPVFSTGTVWNVG